MFSLKFTSSGPVERSGRQVVKLESNKKVGR